MTLFLEVMMTGRVRNLLKTCIMNSKCDYLVIFLYFGDSTYVSKIKTSCKLKKDDKSKDAYQRLYISMIGSLLYVIALRQDLMQVVGHVARFQAALNETHVMVVKKIFRYIKATKDYGLWYLKGNDISLVAYKDAEWVGSVDDRRSTSGTTFYMGDCLVSWFRKKQSLVSLYKVELEYIETTTCFTQVLWMNQTLQDIHVKYDDNISIVCDNTNTIIISKNLVMHSKMKHIMIKYHFLPEHAT
jgi:hypothetical protein